MIATCDLTNYDQDGERVKYTIRTYFTNNNPLLHTVLQMLCKNQMSSSGVSMDIFIKVETFSVFSLAQNFVLIKFLLNPLSHSTEETGTVRASVGNFKI